MLIQKISQEALANMVGTSRARVSLFMNLMNRFRRLGFIDYNGRVHAIKSLLNVILHDQISQQVPERHPRLRSPGLIAGNDELITQMKSKK